MNKGSHNSGDDPNIERIFFLQEDVRTSERELKEIIKMMVFEKSEKTRKEMWGKILALLTEMGRGNMIAASAMLREGMQIGYCMADTSYDGTKESCLDQTTQ